MKALKPLIRVMCPFKTQLFYITSQTLLNYMTSVLQTEVCIAGMTFVLSNYRFNLELLPLHVNHYGVTIAA